MREAWRVSRRLALWGALSALAAAGWRRPAAAAEEKLSKAEAKYQNHPNGQQRCEICLQFLPPNQCRIVQGPIIARGWCQYFAARENAR